MTDLDTDVDAGPPRVRRQRPPVSDQARARRAAARAAAFVPPAAVEPPAAGEVTTEIEAYVEMEAAIPVAPRSRTRRLQGSLANLDALAAARPFPDPSIGLNVFDAVEITLAKPPLLVRLLRLQHLRPTGWQRAAVGDLPILIAVLLVLADLATAWTLLVLPAVVLGLVKFHDIIESRLAPLPVARPVDRPFSEAGL